jgi:hypothetical protein
VHGVANGESFEVHGVLQLASMSLLGQQIRRLESPLDVVRGAARLDSIRGELLGGKVTGQMSVSLDTTPKYEAAIAVTGADLQQYAMTLSGHQGYRGLVNARIALNGSGSDLRTIQGDGEAHVIDGDLGQLPVFLRLVNVLQLSPATKTAFDSADVVWTVQNGRTDFHPVRLTGKPFSLMGPGTMDVQGDLDERLHIGFLSDLVREASGQLWVVRVRGTPAFPQPKLEPLPELIPELKILGQRRDAEGR